MKRYLLIGALALTLTALSILVYGYEYGVNPNQIQVLPYIEKIKDPSLFTNDYYVDTLRSFPSIYPYVMAFISRWIGLETLHFILYFMFKFMLLVFAYNLAYFLFRSDKTAMLSIFIFAFSPFINIYGLLGHDPLMKTAFYQTSAVAPFTILAMSFFLKRRYLSASLTLAGIYYINALAGNFLLVIILFAAAREYIYENKSAEIKRMFSAFCALLLLMIPAAGWMAYTNIRFPGHASYDFVLWLKSWYPGHYFPSFWPRAQWHTIALMLPFFLIFFRKGFRHCRERKTIQAFLWGLVTVWSIALIFGDFLPERFIILLQFFRSDALFIILGIIFAADYIRSLFVLNDMRGMIMGILIICALIEFIKPYYAAFILIALLMYEYRITFAWKVFFLSLIAVSVVYFSAVGAPTKVLSMLVLFVFMLIDVKGAMPQRFLNAAIVFMVAFSLIPYISTIRYRIYNRNLSNSVGDQVAGDWKRLQSWARYNTLKDAVFIAPLDMNGFRVFSGRSVFVDWVDGAAMHWAPGFEALWAGRIAQLGCGRRFMEANAGLICGFGSSDMKSLCRIIYNRLDENDFRALKRDFGTGYVIEDKARQLSFPEVYRNGSFHVYRIE